MKIYHKILISQDNTSKINLQSLEDTQVGYTLQKKTFDKCTLKKYTLGKETFEKYTFGKYTFKPPELKNNWGLLSSTFHVGRPGTLTEWKSESVTNGGTDMGRC